MEDSLSSEWQKIWMGRGFQSLAHWQWMFVQESWKAKQPAHLFFFSSRMCLTGLPRSSMWVEHWSCFSWPLVTPRRILTLQRHPQQILWHQLFTGFFFFFFCMGYEVCGVNKHMWAERAATLSASVVVVHVCVWILTIAGHNTRLGTFELLSGPPK